MAWGSPDKKSHGLWGGREVFGPLALMLLPPPTEVVLVWLLNYGGGLSRSLPQLWATALGYLHPFGLLQQLPLDVLRGVWAWAERAPFAIAEDLQREGADRGSFREALVCVGVFALVQLLLMRLVPGPNARGPVTKTGHVPEYTDNGFVCYVLTLGTFVGLSKEVAGEGAGLWDGSIVARNMLHIAVVVAVVSWVVPWLLAYKGLYAPSTADSGTNGSLWMDLYWGTELYPRVWGWDVKQFTNCRFGMMAWPLVAVSYMFLSAELNGGHATWASTVCTLLQLVYVSKFFYWEVGYLNSMDIMHDRAGFYICGGCIMWVPTFYTSQSQFWGRQTVDVDPLLAQIVLVVGVLCIFLNFEADRQRQFVRLTNGNCTLWGSRPELVHASYTTTDGQERSSILLASHLWKPARHFHYVFEILSAFAWSVPLANVNGSFSPLVVAYPIFLTILLLDRAVRDDARCRDKYGASWTEYCAHVPYLVLPNVF